MEDDIVKSALAVRTIAELFFQRRIAGIGPRRIKSPVLRIIASVGVDEVCAMHALFKISNTGGPQFALRDAEAEVEAFGRKLLDLVDAAGKDPLRPYGEAATPAAAKRLAHHCQTVAGVDVDTYLRQSWIPVRTALDRMSSQLPSPKPAPHETHA